MGYESYISFYSETERYAAWRISRGRDGLFTDQEILVAQIRIELESLDS